MAPLFDYATTARHLDRAYQTMWDVRLTQVTASRPREVVPANECVASRLSWQQYRECIAGWRPFHIVVDPASRRRDVIARDPDSIDNVLLQRSEQELRAAVVSLEVRLVCGFRS